MKRRKDCMRVECAGPDCEVCDRFTVFTAASSSPKELSRLRARVAELESANSARTAELIATLLGQSKIEFLAAETIDRLAAERDALRREAEAYRGFAVWAQATLVNLSQLRVLSAAEGKVLERVDELLDCIEAAVKGSGNAT